MISYYLIVNIITFIIWGYDKFRATFQQWRVPEKTLTFLIILGGGIGALLGITVFRHKSRKSHFKYLSLAFILIHVILFIYVLG